ncbi:MAG: asparagine synthase (glutamine-hydrolyzing) [Proteobacteria bacterium]|nr:asparagine synthase (glutamine-hydrolyzing) [Pseudomonadota bacterium]
MHDAPLPDWASAEVQRMIQLIGHRGPDELRYFAAGRAALASARLSVIDIVHGHQPMPDPTGRYWIAYNGEVYNYPELRAILIQRGHAFRTESDTEVVLKAWIEWGPEAISRFDGGFAFAIYDRERQSLHLARDRAGKRPLFYIRNRGTVAFASEMKAFFACDGFAFDWDPDQLASIFTVWTPVGEQTGFRGVMQVPAGSVLSVDGAEIDVTPCVDLPKRTAATTSLAEAADTIRGLLDESVRKRLRSDVEVAVFVSGGLDSTIVTKLARDHQPGRIRTYSVRFDDSDFDETADQQEVVARYALENRAVTIKPGSIADNFEAALWHAEVPQFRTAFVPMYLLAQQVHADGIKVVLSGEGADEVFFGYDIFKETVLRASWDGLDPATRRDRVSSLYPYLKHFSAANIAPLEALFSRTSGGVDDLLYSHRIRLNNSGLSRRLVRSDLNSQSALADLAERSGIAGLKPLRRAQWLEWHTLLQGYLLSTQSDRMLFAHGVEPRCPFLAPEVLEYVAGLPEDILLSPRFEEKFLLKKAFADDVPARVLSKPKWPYRAPDAASFVGTGNGRAAAEWIDAALADESLQDIAPLEAGIAGRLRDKALNAKGSLSQSDNQAFIFLLSLAILNDLYIRRRGLARFGQSSRRVHRVTGISDAAEAGAP